MGLHGVSICEGHDERGSDAANRTDGAEQVGALIALVRRLTRPCSAPGPLPDETVLLADARLILEPEFDRLALREMSEMSLQRRRGIF
ncbi:UNVERIFIED_ORG: hypothetical protein ABID33_002252 [Xanthobacter viscosus]